MRPWTKKGVLVSQSMPHKLKGWMKNRSLNQLERTVRCWLDLVMVMILCPNQDSDSKIRYVDKFLFFPTHFWSH